MLHSVVRLSVANVPRGSGALNFSFGKITLLWLLDPKDEGNKSFETLVLTYWATRLDITANMSALSKLLEVPKPQFDSYNGFPNGPWGPVDGVLQGYSK